MNYTSVCGQLPIFFISKIMKFKYQSNNYKIIIKIDFHFAYFPSEVCSITPANRNCSRPLLLKLLIEALLVKENRIHFI